jgi:polynucleotide 5'-kinase involved in rRNA processing
MKNQQQAVPPLVINIHGWIKGIGLEILFNMIKTIRPNHIVQLHLENENPLSFSSLFQQIQKEHDDIELPTVHNLPSQSTLPPRYFLQ